MNKNRSKLKKIRHSKMGGQRRGPQEVQLKRAKRAQRRANRKKGESSVGDEARDNATVRNGPDVEDSKSGQVKDERRLKVNGSTIQHKTENEGVRLQIKNKNDGGSKTTKEKDGEGQSIQKTDVGMEKTERFCNLSKLETSSSSSIVLSSLPPSCSSSSLQVDTSWTCYAPTCTKTNLKEECEEAETRSNPCYSPSCRSASDGELTADLKALTALSLELETTSDQKILGKSVMNSPKLVTQKKSLQGRLNQDDGQRSMLQELQDIISEESIPEGSYCVDSNHSQNYEERSEMCAWEVKEFKKTFETIQLDILSLEARIKKLEEKKARARKLKEEQQKDTKQVILPQPIVVKSFGVDDDSDFEEFTRDKQEMWENQEEGNMTWQESIKLSKEGNKPWQEDWEDDFEVEELASVLLLAVK